jgi:hypothetical protein
MRPTQPNDPAGVNWGIPVVIAAVVGGLVIWRTIVGRDEPAQTPTAPSGEASAASAPSSAPLAPRCFELSKQAFMIGESGAPRPAPPPSTSPSLEGGAPVEVPDEMEDDLTPFAVEIGRGAVFSGGFAAGARRDAEGGAIAMVATIGLDGTGGKLVKLGRSRGDLDPPVVTGAGDVVLAALIEPNASGRSIRIAKVKGDDVTWGVELSEGHDDSAALDLAASGTRAIVVWDDVPAGEKRSQVMLSSFDVATMRSVTPARPVSSPKTDAASPRLITRPGGYWLGYLASAAEAPKKGKKDPSNAGEKEKKKGDDDGDDESGEAIQNGWIEIMPLDENGAPTASARAVTPRTGHALAFDLELGEDGAALLAWRDDDTPTGSTGGRLSSALVRLGGAIEVHVLAEESFGAGVPDLLPGWLVVGGLGATKLATIDLRGVLTSGLDPEPSLGTGEPLAATKDAILIAQPAGKAMRLGVVHCAASPAAAVVPGGTGSAMSSSGSGLP